LILDIANGYVTDAPPVSRTVWPTSTVAVPINPIPLTGAVDPSGSVTAVPFCGHGKAEVK